MRDTDVIVIGSGLSGLTSACLLAREGFRVELFEKNQELGGYATTFQDPAGRMTFERSLSSLGGLNPGGPVRRNLELLGVMDELSFVSPDYLFRAVYPDHDLKIPHSDTGAYVRTFAEAFPAEHHGLRAMVAEIVAVYAEYDRLQRNHFKDIYTNVNQYRSLIKYSKWTQQRFLDQFLKDERLKTLVASQWGYLGMPPSRLPAMTFITFSMEYVFYGAHFPLPDCHSIVAAIVRKIEAHGGRLHTGTRVRRILLEGGKAVGVELFGGAVVTARTVIANVNPFVVIEKLIGPEHFPSAYVEKLNALETSLSNLVIYLGLEKPVGDLYGVDAFEMVVSDRYDIEGMYRNCRLGRYEDVEIKLTLYDNLPLPEKPAYGRITIDLYSGSGAWRGLTRAQEEEFKARIYAGRPAPPAAVPAGPGPPRGLPGDLDAAGPLPLHAQQGRRHLRLRAEREPGAQGAQPVGDPHREPQLLVRVDLPRRRLLGRHLVRLLLRQRELPGGEDPHRIRRRVCVTRSW